MLGKAFYFLSNCSLLANEEISQCKKAISSVFLSADEIGTDTAELSSTVIKLHLLKQDLE